jgi:large subunit ribosomal protein L13
MQKENANKVLTLAVKRMLPSGPLGRAMLKKLFLYEGATHNQVAQQPKPIELQK